MSEPRSVVLPEGHLWFRVANAAGEDPLDATYADSCGGRWNTAGDGPTLYLCEDLQTARGQIVQLLDDTPVDPTDLAQDAPFILVGATLPGRQRVADATTDAGLRTLGLPVSYPRRARRGPVPWRDCRSAAGQVRARGLRGVLARPAMTAAGLGVELAWFPAAHAHARAVGEPARFSTWWNRAERAQ